MSTFDPAQDPFDDEEVRGYARRLFGRERPAETPAEPPQHAADHHVPHEGGNPDPGDDVDMETRRFVARLFDTPDQDHI